MKTRFRLIFAIIFIYFAASGAAHAGRLLDLFMEKYHAVNGRMFPMAHPNSPFYRYYDRDFEEGLDESQRELLPAAQEAGKCILVNKLMVDGFLSLWPSLKPAFADADRHSKLTIMMSTSSPPAMSRCHNHSFMSELFAKRRREEFPPVDFVEGAANYDKWRNETDLDLKKLRMTVRGFGQTALCDDYRLSIADLIPIVNRPGGLALTPQEELYLVERARLHNLSNGAYDKAIFRLSKQFVSEKDFLRLRNASRVRKLEAIPFTVKGYWQANCRYFERFRRKEH